MRLIDADSLKDKECAECDYRTGDDCRNQCGIMDRIDSIPTEERRCGKWLDHPNKALKEWMVCSSCGIGCKLIEHLDDSIKIQMYVFCPHCGADMRGNNEN